MKKLAESNLLFAIVFLGFLLIMGLWADKNLYLLKRYDEMQSSYDFETAQTDQKEIDYYTINFPLKVEMIDINGLVRRIVGQREMNGVVKLNNGHLTEVTEPMTEEYIELNAQGIIDFNEYCEEQGIVVLYAQPPYKISKWDDELPLGVTDGHNETIDQLLAKLSDAGVQTLDLRSCMYEDGVDQYDLYYKTDHHWSTRGAFYAYQQIASWISENTNTYLDQELLNLDNYQIDTYPNWHLGSRGQRTGALFAGVDDFDLIYPAFDTHLFNSSEQTIQTLKDALIRMDMFEKQDKLNHSTYDNAYANADVNALSSQDAQTDLNVLLLSDSFRHAICPYMLLTYDQFHVTGYDNLSTAVLAQYQPDVVVIIAWPGNLLPEQVIFQFIDSY